MLTGTPSTGVVKPEFLYIQRRNAWWITGGLSRVIFTWQPSTTHTSTWRYVRPYLSSSTCTSMCRRDLTMLLSLSKGRRIRMAKRTMYRWLLLMVRGKTTMKLKHTLKDVMSLLPRHRGVFSLLECMKGHRLSHTLSCTSLECIRLCTMIMPVFLKLLITSKTRKQRSLNTSKPILITPWPEKSRTWIFPLCLHGPMGRKNGLSGRDGAVLGAFISSVLLLANVISCVHC